MTYDDWKLETPPETIRKCTECGEELNYLEEKYCTQCLKDLTDEHED